MFFNLIPYFESTSKKGLSVLVALDFEIFHFSSHHEHASITLYGTSSYCLNSNHVKVSTKSKVDRLHYCWGLRAPAAAEALSGLR
jgi:hypothetical protein